MREASTHFSTSLRAARTIFLSPRASEKCTPSALKCSHSVASHLAKEILVAIKAGSRLSYQLHGFVVVSDNRNATHDQGAKNLLECLPGLVGGSAQYNAGGSVEVLDRVPVSKEHGLRY